MSKRRGKGEEGEERTEKEGRRRDEKKRKGGEGRILCNVNK